MNHQGGAFVNRRRRLNKEPPGMEQRQDDEHNVVNVQFEENIGIGILLTRLMSLLITIILPPNPNKIRPE